MRNCSEEPETEKPSSEVVAYAVLSTLNIILSVTATLGNALILVSLRKVSSIYPPSKALFKCLAFTDLCVGLFAQPLYAVYIMLDDVTKMTKTTCSIRDIAITVNNISSFVLCGVSMFTSTAISVDRLLALSLGIRHRVVVSLRRVRAVIASFWVTSIFSLFLHVFLRYSIAETVGIAFVILSVVVSVFCYTKIFLKLRRHQAQVEGRNRQEQQKGGETRLNIIGYKKTVSCIGWIQLVIISCYFPYIFSVIMVQTSVWKQTKILARSTVTLVYLNSSLNPLLYVWKIREVRFAVKNTLMKLCCRL